MSFLLSAKEIFRNAFTSDSSRSILPFVPRPLRVLAVVVLILNTRSLPFVWHYRVFKPLLYIRVKQWFLRFSSQETKDAWFESLCPIGESPFALKTTYTTWTDTSEADYNVHLSNSSYAKVLDMARFKFALQYLAAIFRDKCWVALGATHFKFIREIPLGAKYEIRMYIGSWDAKWIYIVARFVSRDSAPSGDAKTRERLQGAKEVLQSSSGSTGISIPQLHTPAAADDVSGAVTPNPALISSPAEFNSLWAEAPGETLHCVAVSEMCYKVGRVTVPPTLALAACGCGMSREQWAEVTNLRKGKAMRELLVGGWKNVPEGKRWWEDALGEFEGERMRRLAVLKGVHEGLEATGFL